MSEERNRAIWPWITGGLIGLPALYIALLWPTCWLADRGIISSAEVYRPLARLAAKHPGPVRDAYSAYVRLGYSRDGLPSKVGYRMLLEEWSLIHVPEKIAP